MSTTPFTRTQWQKEHGFEKRTNLVLKANDSVTIGSCFEPCERWEPWFSSRFSRERGLGLHCRATVQVTMRPVLPTSQWHREKAGTFLEQEILKWPDEQMWLVRVVWLGCGQTSDKKTFWWGWGKFGHGCALDEMKEGCWFCSNNSVVVHEQTSVSVRDVPWGLQVQPKCHPVSNSFL